MNHRLLLCFFVLLFTAGFLTATTAQQIFPRHVGEIHYDSIYDDPAFKIGDSLYVLEYYNTGSYYRSHKKEISQFLCNGYMPQRSWSDQNGFFTVRFIINNQGQTGCFRLFQLDTAYQPAPFKNDLRDTLLNLVKRIPGWQPARYMDKVYDSYQYITFRIKNGKIISITP